MLDVDLGKPAAGRAYDKERRKRTDRETGALVGGFVAVSAGAAVDRGAALHELVEIHDLCGKQRASGRFC